MKQIKKLMEEYYKEFEGLPCSHPIVRNNQINDAFALVVLKAMFGRFLDFKIEKSNIAEISKLVVAPPDGSIDIFFQREDGDEYSFDVVQVKNSELTEDEIRSAIGKMKRAVRDYVKNPQNIKSESLKEILAQSGLDKGTRNNCTYYVVHAGKLRDFAGSEEDEKVLTVDDLSIILKNDLDFVREDSLHVDGSMLYGNERSENSALVCSVSGYDLAELNNKYFQTETGRNILFGSNLRENLNTTKSERYLGMARTISEKPENFWYYNNGITIIADSFKQEGDEIVLKKFSIVNGAQTTSSLGIYLKEALKNRDENRLNSLKKVFVLARILRASKKEMRQDIAIFNNTQNPITSRDMVANREEQLYLSKWLLSGEPRIYVEIRRGRKPPADFNKRYAHRKTTNEELAQIAYAAFKIEPFSAKDKKKSLFNNDFTQKEVAINTNYHSIFNWVAQDSEENGILFKKTKVEIEEALFVQKLYKEAKKYLRNEFSSSIALNEDKKRRESDEEKKKSFQEMIDIFAAESEAVGVCMFYFIAFYYKLKEQFDVYGDSKVFDYKRYYSDSSYKNAIIKDISIFVQYAADILVETARIANKANVNNWVRMRPCEAEFLKEVQKGCVRNREWKEKFKSFLDRFKV